MKDNLKKAQTLIEALPYIQKFRGKTVVLKFGGTSVGTIERIKKTANLKVRKICII